MTDTFRNPILPGDRPDPAILRDGDDYWLTYSSFDSAPGILLYHSTDLVNWTYEGSALQDPPGVVFAMDIAKVDDRYYIYIPFIPASWSTAITEPSIYVIHAPSMRGPWSAPIDLGIRRAIDPGHLQDADGRRHLFTNGIRHVELSDDGLSAKGELESVYDGWSYPEDWVTEAYALEGPKLFRRGEWYYLVSAVGGTAGPATGHMVIVARSRTPRGPWQNHPRNPIARTASDAEAWWSRGHATIFAGPHDRWWMISHGYANGYRSLGRQVLLEPIEWTSDDWPVAVAPDIAAPLTAPLPGSKQEGEADHSLTLSSPTLGEHWRFHAPGPAENARLEWRSGGLALRARGSGPADTSPLTTLVGAHRYEVEVHVDLEDDEVEAGLLLFFNNRLFCGFGIGPHGMASYSGGIRTHWNEPMPPTRSVGLRLRNDRHIVTGWYRIGANDWVRHGVRYETSGYHVNTIGDLQGLRPALYSSGNGVAFFAGFAYRQLHD